METKKEQGGLSTKLLLGIIALLLVAIVVLLVLLLSKPAADVQTQTPTGVTTQEESKPIVQELDPEDTLPEATEESGIALVTKYTRFTYPEDLKDILIVREDETEDRFEASFSMIAAEQEVELFAIILSQAEEEGYKLGTLEDETYGTVIVTTRINEQKATDWPEDVFAQINAMQERINDILIQFYEDPRFTPAK